MPWPGKKLLPREIAQLGKPHWKNYELVKMVATALGESAGVVGAYNDNLAGEDTVSRDCGLMEINIPADQIGTAKEDGLRTESLDESVWRPVAVENVAAAYRLYEEPGPNTGLRRWQPWVAYTTGWATFPGWWVWHQNADHEPIGPWIKTGRYIQQAIAGVSNFHLVIAHDMTENEALALASANAKHFKATEGKLAVVEGLVVWTNHPPMPSAPPVGPPEPPVGPRPVPNNGA